MIRRGLGDDRGSVVAEFAVALPAVALVVLLGAGALGACARQVRLQDAAADAARLAARGEPDVRRRRVRRRRRARGDTALERRGDLVCVTVSVVRSTAHVPIALTRDQLRAGRRALMAGTILSVGVVVCSRDAVGELRHGRSRRCLLAAPRRRRRRRGARCGGRGIRCRRRRAVRARGRVASASGAGRDRLRRRRPRSRRSP